MPNGEAAGGASAREIEKLLATSPAIKAPDKGIADLRRMVIGPFADPAILELAEQTLLQWGPATVVDNGPGQAGSVQAIVAEENLAQIIATLRARKIYKITRTD